MSQTKPWDWKVGASAFWMQPSEESYYLAVRWREKGYKSILDLGSGLGRHAVYFTQQGFHVSAIDLSADGISHLSQMASDLGMNIPMVVGEMDHLPYADASFDCVFSMNVIYHADKPTVIKTIAEIERVLKPGGEFFLTFCAKDTPAFLEGRYPKVDEYTVLKTEPPEQDVPHFFVDLTDIPMLLSHFTVDRVRHTEDCFFNGNPVKLSRHFAVLCVKAGDGRF